MIVKNFNQAEKGLVLILVLWVLFFLSVIALTLSFKNRINIKLRSLNNEELRIFYLLREGINRAILELLQECAEFDSLNDNWNKEFSLQSEEGLLSYRIIDDDRFMNINSAPKELLDNLKIVLPEITSEILTKIVESRPFNLKQEILNISGISEEMFYGDACLGKIGLQDLITVFSDSKININTASKNVLMLIPEMTEIIAQIIIDSREGSPFKNNDTLSEELSQAGLTAAQISSIIKFSKVNSSVFFIASNAVSNKKHIAKNLEIVLTRDKQKAGILYYKEN